MIWHIILGIWLVPVIIGLPLSIIAIMIQERSFLPFDEIEDPFIFTLAWLVWPLLVYVAIDEYRTQRKDKLKEVEQTIEAHYRDKWYE